MGDAAQHYDLFVLGAGSGRVVLGPDLAHLRAAIVDHGPYGGTCLNRGCIPSKMFVHVARAAAGVPDLARLGVDARVERVRWDDIRDRVFGRIDLNAAAGPAEVRSAGVDAYVGTARFVAPGRLVIEEGDGVTEVTAERVVLATGARPVVPDVVANSGVPFVTSDDVMRLPALPERLLVLGGGVIGVEMATLFCGMGVRVTVVDSVEALVPTLGADIARRFTDMARTRWALHLGAEVTAVEQGRDGIHLRLDDGTALTGDALLVATGRRPNSDGFGLETIGVDIDPDSGRVLVDDFGRTSADGVWALGDVCTERQLKHLANDQARTLRHNLLTPDDLKPFRTKAIPSAIFSQPELARVGYLLEEAQKEGHDAVAYTQRLSDTAYGWALEDTTSVCTVVAERSTGVVLGAQLMAPNASSLIQPLTDACARGRPAREIATTQMWIHPAATELIENALLGVADAAEGDSSHGDL